MSRKAVFRIVIAWICLMLFDFYFNLYFFVALDWLVVSLLFFFLSLYQLIVLVVKRRSATRLRIQKVILFPLLFLLTFYRVPGKLIERVDWYVLYGLRNKIVGQVLRGELKPNVAWNKVVCELPYEFPVVSNGGNDIIIWKGNDTNSVTIEFYIFRNFFESPSTKLIYTNDTGSIGYYERKIKADKKDNWKLRDNWYRILDDD